MPSLPAETVIPHGSVLHHIEDSYGPLQDEVSCGLEGCRTPHKKGFIVAFTDPAAGEMLQRGIVGHVCGRKRFGTTWVDAERAYDVKRRAEAMDAAWARFHSRTERVLPELRAALPTLRWQNTARKTLEGRAPDVMLECSKAVRAQNGMLQIVDGRKVTPLHLLRGQQFWLDYHAWFRAGELERDITRFQEYLQSDEATVKEANRRLERFTDIERRWGLVVKAMDAAAEALRPGHLMKVFEAVNAIREHEPKGWNRAGVGAWHLPVRVMDGHVEAWLHDWTTRTNGWHRVIDLRRPGSNAGSAQKAA